jgi:hypothetical protein
MACTRLSDARPPRGLQVISGGEIDYEDTVHCLALEISLSVPSHLSIRTSPSHPPFHASPPVSRLPSQARLALEMAISLLHDAIPARTTGGVHTPAAGWGTHLLHRMASVGLGVRLAPTGQTALSFMHDARERYADRYSSSRQLVQWPAITRSRQLAQRAATRRSAWPSAQRAAIDGSLDDGRRSPPPDCRARAREGEKVVQHGSHSARTPTASAHSWH